MSGRHIAPSVSYDKDAQPAQVFPATGKQFASPQTHWFRVADGMVIEHWADRDDLGTATQLGWIPPSPWYTVTLVHRAHAAGVPAGPDGTRGVTSRPAGDRAQPSAARIPAASSPTCSSVITKAGEIWMPPAPTARVAIPCLRNVLASPSAAAGSAS